MRAFELGPLARAKGKKSGDCELRADQSRARNFFSIVVRFGARMTSDDVAA